MGPNGGPSGSHTDREITNIQDYVSGSRVEKIKRLREALGGAVQEELTMRIIARTKNYPSLLVQHGHVHFNEEDLSKTIGSVFLEKTELNLQVPPPCASASCYYCGV